MPKGEYDAPGPFSRKGGMVFRQYGERDDWGVANLHGALDEAERDELLGLLNKGTHFERLVAAVKSALEDGFETYSPSIDGEGIVIDQSVIDVLRAAIAAAEEAN